jgi:hypothetical protein
VPLLARRALDPGAVQGDVAEIDPVGGVGVVDPRPGEIGVPSDSAGNPIATAKITLTHVEPRREFDNGCGGSEVTPHGAYPFDRQPN